MTVPCKWPASLALACSGLLWSPAAAPAGVTWPFKGSSSGVPTWDMTETTPDDQALVAAIVRMKANGVTWYQLGTSWFMPSMTSSTIQPIFDRGNIDPAAGSHLLATVSDARLEQIIDRFQAQGVKVFLRPGIEPNLAGWRGRIAPTDWNAWFQSYKAFIQHYAALAQRKNVAMLSIGFELDSSVARTAQWNEVIQAVRAIYSGPISYDCGGVLYHGNEASYTTSSFTADWQAAACGDFAANVDFIGIDWYPPIAGSPTSGVQEMASNVRAIADQFLAPLAQRHGKPVFFAEIDYASANRSAMNPLLYRSGEVDAGEQATAFEAVFRALADKPWFAGMFPASHFLTAQVDQQGTTNTVWFKPAEGVFRRWYGGGALPKTECLFNWAESAFPQLFPRQAEGGLSFVSPFYFRYYPSTGTHLGASTLDEYAWLMGPSTDHQPVPVAPLADYLSAAGC